MIPEYALDLWKILLDVKKLKGLEFESEVNNSLEEIGFRKLTRHKAGRNYIKGASGVTHEIDICAYNADSNELLIGECKTSRLIRYRNVLNFIAKSKDIVDRFTKEVSPTKVTKILIATNDFDPNGYKICWFYGIIPFQCSNPVPIFLASRIIENQMAEIEKSGYSSLKIRSGLSASASEIVKETDSFWSGVGAGKQYDLKADKKLRPKIYDLHATLTQVQKILVQLRELGYRIPEYLANLVLSGEIKDRESYVEAKSQLLQRFDLASASLSDYDILITLYRQECEPSSVKAILPHQFHCYEIAERILNQEIDSAMKFWKATKAHKKRVHHYTVMQAAFSTMKEKELQRIVDFYIENLKISYNELRYVSSRHILREMAGYRISNTEDLESYIKRTNRIFRFRLPLSSTDLVRYAKYHELKRVLGLYFPYLNASRSIADLIILGNIRSSRDLNYVRVEIMDLYWLDQRPSYNSILEVSPVTDRVQRFFRRLGVFLEPKIFSHHRELVKADKDLGEIVRSIAATRITKAKLCKACGKRIASRLIKIALEPTLVCNNCFDLFKEILA